MTAATIISVLFIVAGIAGIAWTCRDRKRHRGHCVCSGCRARAAERESADMDQAVAIVSEHAADFAAWEADMRSGKGAGH